jgi:enoyl-[acyl-carrier protein] reductase III
VSKELDGRLALVTGGSRGIGRAITLDLVQRGAAVAFSYLRNGDAAEETLAQVKALGGTAYAIKGRIDDTERCNALVDEAEAQLGGLDLLVSNAASGVIRPLMELTEKHWDWTLDTNARALMLLSQRAAPLMEARGGGGIVAISSLGSFRVLDNYTLVGVSKAALEACVRYLAVELAPMGIRVNCLAPGPTETEAASANLFPTEEIRAAMTENIPLRRFASLEDITNSARFLLSDEGSYITGETLVLDGGESLYKGMFANAPQTPKG